jgi:hypothetical protein
VDVTSVAFVLTTALLALFRSSSVVTSPALAVLSRGLDRRRSVVIRTGERGNGVF